MISYIIFFLLLLSYGYGMELVNNIGGETTFRTSKVRYLDAGSTFHYIPIKRPSGFFENDFQTYCFRGNKKTIARMFESIEIQFDVESDDYMQYEGETPEEVQQHYDERRSLFSFSLFNQKRARLQLSPFKQQCIGIEASQPYRVYLERLSVDFWRIVQIIGGVLIFVYAGQFSQNTLFYYIVGVLLGITSSFMLLMWLTSKLLPRKTLVYGALVGGWAIGLYMIQLVWQNLQTIILTYKTYVLWYLLTTGVISFFFCYRWGPPTNKRSKNIIKWSLQLIALIFIYLSTQFEEAGAAAVMLSIIIHYFPCSIFKKVRSVYLKFFPPKRRFLTNEEYYEQGVRETVKALEELRAYASSPECNQWKIMSRLSDPFRFAAFVEGDSHLKDEEILNFEDSNYDAMNDSDPIINDDDDYTSEDHENQLTNFRPARRRFNNVEYTQSSDDSIEFREAGNISSTLKGKFYNHKNGVHSSKSGRNRIRWRSDPQ